MYCIIIALLCISKIATGVMRILPHPLEKHIAYVYDYSNPSAGSLRDLLRQHPLLIFPNMGHLKPEEFAEFVKGFDADCDEAAWLDPVKNPMQWLQPFDSFLAYPQIAPRGHTRGDSICGVSHLYLEPRQSRLNRYEWQSEMMGHSFKLPPSVTGYYFVDQPVIGGETDFISGETVFENLSKEEQLASISLLTEVNRQKIITQWFGPKGESVPTGVGLDYAGITRNETYVRHRYGNTQLPLVYAPNDAGASPSLILSPVFFERLVGWSIDKSREWLQRFMLEKVLPHRVTVQWRKGDLAVFCNRRWMVSATPSRNYLDNRLNNTRLMLKTLIPTNRDLIGMMPSVENGGACYRVGWLGHLEESVSATMEHIRFAKKRNGGAMPKGDRYVVSVKPVRKPDGPTL